MLAQLRQKIHQNPRLRERLLPLWIWFHDLRWQARNVITRRRPILSYAGDSAIKLHCDGQIPKVLYLGDFEPVERDFMAAYLRPGMCVLDVGANVGLYTVLASALVGPTGQVHAFEPSVVTHEWLLKNLRLNGCRNVKANRLALSKSERTMVLRADSSHPSHDGHRYVEQMDKVDRPLDTDEIVDCITLDDYVLNLGLNGVDFAKMDVEGAELLVLQGATALLARAGDLTLMLECTRNKAGVAELLTGLGYSFFRWDVRSRSLLPSSFEDATERGLVIVRRCAWGV